MHNTAVSVANAAHKEPFARCSPRRWVLNLSLVSIHRDNNDIKPLAPSLIGQGYIYYNNNQTTTNTSWPKYLGDSAAIERYRLMYTRGANE